MIALQKLKTKSKLAQMNLLADDQFQMCLVATETIEDMFFLCPFSARCMKELGNWLSLLNFPLKLANMITYKWKATGLHKKVVISGICSLYYYIWKTRNEAIWLLHMSTVDKIMNQIKSEIKTKFFTLYPEKLIFSC